MELDHKYVGQICTPTGILQGLVTNLCRVYASLVNAGRVEVDGIDLEGTSADTILDFGNVKNMWCHHSSRVSSVLRYL